MTKTQKKKKVESLAKKYAEKLNLGHWKINVILSDQKDSDCCAEIKSDDRYLFMTITVYPEAFIEPNDIDHIIKHEVCHCLTDPFYKAFMDLLNAKFRTHYEIEDIRERLTEQIAGLI